MKEGDNVEQVFITGADRGVGFALCEQFAMHGYQVLAGQYMPGWKALEGLREKYPDQVTCIALDVGNTESVKDAVRRTADICGKVDILVNCAGIIRDDTREGFRSTLNTNTVGTLRVTELFLPLMETGKKRLCFFSSEAGSMSMLHRTGDGDSSYCTSKAALNMCVRLLFNELQPKDTPSASTTPDGSVPIWQETKRQSADAMSPKKARRRHTASLHPPEAMRMPSS